MINFELNFLKIKQDYSYKDKNPGRSDNPLIELKHEL